MANSVPPSPYPSTGSGDLWGGSGPPGESGGTMFFAGAPRLSARRPIVALPCVGEKPAYPAAVGLFGSSGLNFARLPDAPLPAPLDASEVILVLRARGTRPSSASSCGVVVRLGGFCLLARPSSGYGSACVGGGERGGPYALEGGTLYWAYCWDCWEGSPPKEEGAFGEVDDEGCLRIWSGCGVSNSAAAFSSPMKSSSFW